jgi:hypothetical protein
MDRLSEELLDHVVSEVINLLPNRHRSNYDDLLSLSMVSHKFCRITEPYIYQSLVISGNNGKKLLQTIETRPELLRYVRAVFVMQCDYTGDRVRNLTMNMPNLQELDLNIGLCALSDMVPVLKLKTLKTLHLSGVAARELSESNVDDWGFDNNTLTSLDLSFVEPACEWEFCDEFQEFASVFRNLSCLNIHSNYEPMRLSVLDGPVFRYLVHAFRHAFETTLREFSFEYNHQHNGHFIEEEEVEVGSLGAGDVLKNSRLEKLKIDTICLHKSGQVAKLRSLALGSSYLPTSLHTLYLRHVVASGNLNPIERNLMHSDEAQCLSQLVNLAARRSRFPHLQNLALAICLPPFFEEVASRIVKVQARKVKVRLDLIFM